MTPDRLSTLLATSRSAPSDRGPDCPDEHVLAAYVDTTLDPQLRPDFEMHLADCDHCLALVGLLCRERPLVRHATATPARTRVWAPPRWAAAAVILLAVGALVRVVPTPPLESAPEPGLRDTRSSAAAGLDVVVLSPRPEASVSASQLVVRWKALPGSRFYDVRVVTETGDVVTEEHVSGTEWRPRDPAVLQPGHEYFVHVDAYLTGEKPVSSEHVAFRIMD